MKALTKKKSIDDKINNLIDIITSEMDSNLNDDANEHYWDCIDSNTIVENFLSNYTSRSIGIKNFDELDASQIREKFNDDSKLIDIIQDNSSLEPCDYYTQWNEMASIPMGEIEHTIELEHYPELEQLIRKSKSNWAVSSGQLSAMGNPCDRLILKLDVESFLANLTVIFKAPKKVKKTTAKATIYQFSISKQKQKDPRQRFVEMQLDRAGLMGQVISLKGSNK